MNKSILMLGDSHAEAMFNGFQTLRPDIKVFGGTVRRVANSWENPFHTARSPLQFLHEDVHASFKRLVLPAGYDGTNILDVDLPFVLSISGLPSLVRIPIWGRFYPRETPDRYFVSQQLFEAILGNYLTHVLDLYRCLADAGKTVVCTIMPGLRVNYIGRGDLFLEVKDFLIREVKAMGVLVADVTDATCDEHGVLHEKYWVDDPEDFSHANEAWGQLVASACCRELQM